MKRIAPTLATADVTNTITNAIPPESSDKIAKPTSEPINPAEYNAKLNWLKTLFLSRTGT